MIQKEKSKMLKYILTTIDNLMNHLGTLSAQFKKYIENMDGWVKDINERMSKVDDVVNITNENTDNIQHTYELLYELKDEFEEQKQEINALKLIQIVTLKKRDIDKDLLKERKEIKKRL